VIVQIHGSYQFADVSPSFFLDRAHAAADPGADLVIGHHPHVLQGFEWYDGTLIAHSLENFVFDQDLSSTFSSMILRTVYEGDRLVSATVLPVLLVDYRPVMAAGPPAQAILRPSSVRIRPARRPPRRSTAWWRATSTQHPAVQPTSRSRATAAR
jgi:hypothetical protein